MKYSCLLVDLDNGSAARDWLEHGERAEYKLQVHLVQGLAEALTAVKYDDLVALAIMASDYTRELETVIKAFQRHVGCIPEFQLIFCDDPMPSFMVNVFEHGIDQFVSRRNWLLELSEFTRRVRASLEESDSPELLSINAMRAIDTADQIKILGFEKRLAGFATYSYVAAFAHARALESMGQHEDSLAAFEQSEQLNKPFRPAIMGQCEAHLILGQKDQAISRLNELERSNVDNIDRQLLLAAAHCEKGEFERAAELLSQVEAVDADSPRFKEGRAHFLLSSGKLKEALALMDGLQDVGPNLASKLNELGVRLSQAGKGKSALVLYQRAHKIVKAPLRYKVSLNAALACRRSGDLALAMKFCERSRREYGGTFAKLEKIVANIKAALEKTSAS